MTRGVIVGVIVVGALGAAVFAGPACALDRAKICSRNHCTIDAATATVVVFTARPFPDATEEESHTDVYAEYRPNHRVTFIEEEERIKAPSLEIRPEIAGHYLAFSIHEFSEGPIYEEKVVRLNASTGQSLTWNASGHKPTGFGAIQQSEPPEGVVALDVNAAGALAWTANGLSDGAENRPLTKAVFVVPAGEKGAITAATGTTIDPKSLAMSSGGFVYWKEGGVSRSLNAG
jgi:hypothetical protein